MPDEVRYELRGSAAWLTIDREAQRNTLTLAAVEQLLGHLDRAEADPAVRAVCLTGAGEKVFCAGADLSALGGEGADAGATRYAALLKRLRALGKPLVARVNGHCLAGGLGPMLACDVAVAREGIRVGVPEVTVGLFPMMVAALLLRDGLRKKVLELVYTGEPVTAREAEAAGLLSRVVPDGELDQAVEKVLGRIAAVAPLAVQLGRRALAEAEGPHLDQALDLLSRRLGDVLATEDAAEGLSAFLERRSPRWKGR
ncbi:MAG TPA: enoyl-CoA hydratase-related protein [Anaeromyxobacteraceae bacterium]|nr:enoyl-CoA hydratase-related protein [Anaeromyxobacteraceae bacterium]